MTQDDLAAALNIEQQTISLIENERANPTLLLLDSLATALGIELAELFDVKLKAIRKPLPNVRGSQVGKKK